MKRAGTSIGPGPFNAMVRPLVRLAQTNTKSWLVRLET